MKIECLGRNSMLWALALLATAAAALALPGQKALDVQTSVRPGATRIFLHAPGPLKYSTSHPRQDLYVVDLMGAGARAKPLAQMLVSGIVSSYRLTVAGSGQPGVRLDVLLSQPALLKVDQPNAKSLVLTFSASAAADSNDSGDPGSGGITAQTETSPSSSIATAAPIAANSAASAAAIAAKDQNSGGSSAFHGAPISVNFKDVDLKDFFRLIHAVSGLNVVVDPNVRGTLTIVLDQVPWDQALDIVLRDNGLASQLQGNVLRIATRATLQQEAEQKRDLAKAEAEAASVVTVTRTLSYANAAKLRDTLKQFLSSRGEILADDRSNTLIIRDIPSVLPTIDRLIHQLDRRSPQVEIEARVVEATRSFARELGTQFGFAVAGSTGSSHNVIGGSPSVGTSPVIRNLYPPPPLVSSGTNVIVPGASGSAIPLNANLGASGPTSGITFAHTEPNLALDLVISAAETKGIGRLLSQPKLITQDNEEATVKQGTKIPVQTVVNNTISVQFVDAVLELEVTPQITADGTVFMKIHVENTAVDQGIPRILGIPALDTQSEDTSVLVNDGGTVVIGGIILSQQQNNISQVPLFGSIPVIGHLFKHTAVSTQTQELLFFLTPRVLPG
jgi:type IV pilus secretin PilQ/predicted competence protein